MVQLKSYWFNYSSPELSSYFKEGKTRVLSIEIVAKEKQYTQA